MKKVIIVFSILLSVFTVFAQRRFINISEGWKFGNTNLASVIDPGFNDSGWLNVNLPHTWNALDGQDGGNNYQRTANWYRKKLVIEEKWSEKKIFLRFGAANLKTDVYVNGTFAGNHIGGYAAFIFDITSLINIGHENTIAVRVNNSDTINIAPLSGDFTFFGGLTREVELLITDKTFISPLEYASPGVYLTPVEISENSAKVEAKILISNHHNESENVKVTTVLKNEQMITIDSVSTEKNMDAKSTDEVIQQFSLQNPVFWNGRTNPYLYHVSVVLSVNDIQTDEVVQPLGLRFYSVNVLTGFELNGHNYRLYGVAMHEDRIDKGRAISDTDRKQDIDLMHEMGCTFLRLAHYQHGEYTYDYCDSSGMIVSTEIPLVNSISSSSFFQENAKQQLKELILQNYNHPSVCFWGLCNEVDYKPGPNPAPLIRELDDIAHTLDRKRLTFLSAMMDNRESNWVPDLVSWNKYFGWYGGTYNDFAGWVDKMHTNYPVSKIGISEYGCGANTGQHEVNPVIPANSGPFHPEEYQNCFHETYWQAMEQRPWLWSTAVWVGFDFASDGRNEGKQPGLNDKGMVTRDRQIRKDAFFYYKANWTSDPFVYISSRRYTVRPDSLVEIKVYSNCDSVLIQINDSIYSSVTSQNHIYIWPRVLLASKINTIISRGFYNGLMYLDSCIWQYDSSLGYIGTDTLLPGGIQINFQPASTPAPNGYLIDAGSPYGDRGNSYSYGWNRDITADTRDRNTTENLLFNTFIHMQKDNRSNYWEIALDNGNYLVGVACGDPDYFDSFHEIEAEGKLILRGKHTATSWIKSTDTIAVEDGRLTLKPSPASVNAKLNLVHIRMLFNENTSNKIIKILKKEGNDPMMIFPNPVENILFIKAAVFNLACVIEVHNLDGRRIKSFNNLGKETMAIDVSSLNPGIYSLELKAEGKPKQNARFCKI